MEKETQSITMATKVKPSIKKKIERLAGRRGRKVSYIINEILENKFKTP